VVKHVSGTEHHIAAANHHEQAAAHHRLASEHYAERDYAHAAHQALIAHGHGQQAARHAYEATKYHLEHYDSSSALSRVDRSSRFNDDAHHRSHCGFSPAIYTEGHRRCAASGSYLVEVEEEQLDTSYPAYRRIATLIRLAGRSGSAELGRVVDIDPAELDAVLARDATATVAPTHDTGKGIAHDNFESPVMDVDVRGRNPDRRL
jgi:hypothetical protein